MRREMYAQEREGRGMHLKEDGEVCKHTTKDTKLPILVSFFSDYRQTGRHTTNDTKLPILVPFEFGATGKQANTQQRTQSCLSLYPLSLGLEANRQTHNKGYKAVYPCIL